MIKIAFSILLFLLIASCRDEPIKYELRYYAKGNYIIEESYNSKGKLLVKSSNTKDYVPLGYKIVYYSNGKISKWFWYDTPDKYPLFVIYYDSSGNYQSFKGRPFIQFAKSYANENVVEAVNPPNLYFLIVYEDYLKNKLFDRAIYEPGKTDTTSWATLDKLHSFKNDHHYFVKFVIFDNEHYAVDSLKMELKEPSVQHSNSAGPASASLGQG